MKEIQPTLDAIEAQRKVLRDLIIKWYQPEEFTLLLTAITPDVPKPKVEAQVKPVTLGDVLQGAACPICSRPAEGKVSS